MVEFLKITDNSSPADAVAPVVDNEEADPEAPQNLDDIDNPTSVEGEDVKGQYTIFQFWNFVDDELDKVRKAALDEVGNDLRQREAWVAT